MIEGWSVACVTSGDEQKVCQGLKRLEVSHYSPMCRYRTKRRGPKRNGEKTIEKAAWPGYILLDESTITDQGKIERLQHFICFLIYPWSRRKKVILNAIVASLKDLEKDGALTLSDVEQAMYGVPMGSRVRITEGILFGYQGIVKAMRKEYAEVEGVDFGKSVLIPLEWLEVSK